MKNKSFQDEQNELLEFILKNKFYDKWTGLKTYNMRDIHDTPCLEFIVTPICNKNCEYCYLVKYGNELYPKEIQNQEEILNNLNIILDYYKEKKYRIPKFDFFSGEIWHTDFGIKILVTLLAKIQSGLKVDFVMIPSNFTFINYPEKTHQIEMLIKKYKEAGSLLVFSASLDGKYCESQTRPFNNKTILNDEYYDKLFKFCKKYDYGFHPMMSAYGIDYYKQNYTWFMEMLKKYNFVENKNCPIDIFKYIMFLEVRNDDWTEEKLEKYIDALNYACDYDIDNIWSKQEQGIEFIVSRMSNTSIPPQFKNCYMNYINYLSCDSNGMPGCTISYTLMIRLGDLSIVPCHRTSYNKFLYGKYIKENDKIIGFEAQNPILANRIWNQKLKASPFCDSCYLYNYCMKGCYGSQYEENKDLFYPNMTCCDLFKIKLMFIHYKKEKLIEQFNLDKNLYENNEILSILKCIENENEEKFNKWKKIIQRVIS